MLDMEKLEERERARLESIEEEYRWHVDNQILPRTSDDNFEWLIYQAKQRQVLQNQVDNHVSQTKRVARLRGEKYRVEQQNKKYHDAISDIKGAIPLRCDDELELNSAIISIAKTIELLEESVNGH